MIRVNDLKSHYSIKILVALVLVKLGTAGAVSAMTANFVDRLGLRVGQAPRHLIEIGRASCRERV